MAINLYDQHDSERRAACHAEYVSNPDFPSVEAEARQRGYRHAALHEIHASAYSAPWAVELFCWRGGLWVPLA